MKKLRRVYSDTILGADEENEELLNLMKDIKDDFDFILSGLEKLDRSDREDSQAALDIGRNLYTTMQDTIAAISDRF